ncbi:MFS transporter [Actinoalloteichus caeruleus]|uniref:MFS transporter n=1 Tax=Actinoalloteichus cyanogriseus TaxID=2893586 RepID=UPI003AAEE428
MRGTRVGRALPAAVGIGLLANATFTGLVSVALPLFLADRGAGKGEIALFFVLNALAAAVLNLTVGRVLRRGSSRWAVAGSAGVSALGLVALAVTAETAARYPAGMAVMAMSLVYPQYVAMAHHYSSRSVARTVSSLRIRYVAGYVAGLGVFAVAAEAERVTTSPLLGPVGVAVGLALLNVAVAWLPLSGRPTPERQADQVGPAAAGARWRPSRALVVTAAIAVLSLRAADSLRGVYLPLYANDAGIGSSGVSALFAVTAVVEFAVLVPIAAASDRFGSRPALVVVSLVGLASFLMIVVDAGYPVLVLSQVVYAVFAAGFQSIGLVILGEALASGMGGGAALYTALVQVGSTVGILAPLVVPGYSPAVFLIAVGFCALATVLLLVGRRPTASSDGADPPGADDGGQPDADSATRSPGRGRGRPAAPARHPADPG